jgi:ATP phosphoribosyltransferase regulatory subunit
MKRYDKMTPEGTKDYIFEECRLKRQSEDAVRALLEDAGYLEVLTPALEFFDVYSQGKGKISQNELYTLTDNGGRLLTLRSDSAKPVARLYAARLVNKPLPLRLFYNQPVYRRNVRFNRKLDEVFQTGAELLGGDSLSSDAEAVLLSLKSLKALFGKGFLLEMGHADFMKSVLNAFEPAQAEELKEAIRGKSYPEILRFAQKTEDKSGVLQQLPLLSGGKTVLEQAEKLPLDAAALAAVSRLKQIYKVAEKEGFAQNLVIDLSAVNDCNYYTGIVFKAFIKGDGAEILSGGRYDTLYCDYDLNLPAVGFAINMSDVIRIMRKGE